MGNSLSSISGTGGVGGDNDPKREKYPLTFNATELDSGHYIAFYNDLKVDDINNILSSMTGVSAIVDLTLIIAGARSTTSTVANTSYIIKSIQYRKSTSSDKPDAQTDEDAPKKSESDEKGDTSSSVLTAAATETDDKDKTTKDNDKTTEDNDKSNLFKVTLDKDFLMIITVNSLLKSVNEKSLTVLRSFDEVYTSQILFKPDSTITEHYDAVLTESNDSITIKSSDNPANSIKARKIFMELADVSTIYLETVTLQLTYNARYRYSATYKIENLELALQHINTIRSNENIMTIYYYDNSNKFLEYGLKKFVPEIENITVVNNKNTYFAVGQQDQKPEKNLITFSDRTFDLNFSSQQSTNDFKVTETTNTKAIITPLDISCGYIQTRTLFNKFQDNVTQVFQKNQTIQLSRYDFQLYIGYINVLEEIDIVGTLLNTTTIDTLTQKFILYCNKDIFSDYTSKNSKLFIHDKNMITNIDKLKDDSAEINISQNGYLTLSTSKSSDITQYDIVNSDTTKLQMKTLRNNQIETKQALLSTHSGDMKSTGGYVPDSSIQLPSNYLQQDENSDKFVVVYAIETTPTAVWNMARNLVSFHSKTNWLLYFSLLEKFANSLGTQENFDIVKLSHNMMMVYPKNNEKTVTVNDDKKIVITINETKVLILDEKYIQRDVREQADTLSTFSCYPGKVTAAIDDNFSKFIYDSVKKLSYIEYDESMQTLFVSTNDIFVGGMANTLTLYANLTKIPRPTIDSASFTNTSVKCFDYLPSIKSNTILQQYITVLLEFFNVNSQSYICVIRILKSIKVDEDAHFTRVSGANELYDLLIFRSNDTLTHKFDKSTMTFTFDNYPSITFDTEKAKSKEPLSKDVIYLENPLDKTIKASDDDRYINMTVTNAIDFKRDPAITYNNIDNISLVLSDVTNTTRTDITMQGGLFSSNLSNSRYTYMSMDLYDYNNMLTYILESKTNVTQAPGIIILKNRTLESQRYIHNSLVNIVKNLLKNNEQMTKYNAFYDNVNKLLVLTNVTIVVDINSLKYTINYDNFYIKSKKNPNVTLDPLYDRDFILDIRDSKFEFLSTSTIFNPQTFTWKYERDVAIRVTGAQLDKVIYNAYGVKITSDNNFWKSIRAFVYIDKLMRDEITNLIKFCSTYTNNLQNFFILSIVDHDQTSSNKGLVGNCCVICGNDSTEITINKNQRFYYVKLVDPNYKDSFMKFGMWTDTVNKPGSVDLKDLDFIINKFTGKEYTDDHKISTNERISVVKNFINFEFPEGTGSTFQKFFDFANNKNIYILFARPIPKEIFNSNTIVPQNNTTVAVMEITTTGTAIHLSEVINYCTQFRILSKNTISFIIYTPKNTITQPDKVYEVEIDSIMYSTKNFKFTENAKVLLYPSVELTKVDGVYNINDTVQFLQPGRDIPSVNQNKVLFSGPSEKSGISANIGTSSKYSKLNNIKQQHIDMTINIHDIVTKFPQ